MRQLNRGTSLIESLAATLLLSIGVLGAAQLHLRTQAHAEASQAEGLAVLLATDLGERIRANPSEDAATSAYNQLAPFATARRPHALADVACDTPQRACTHQQMAMQDLQQWQQALSRHLGEAAAFVQVQSAHVDIWVGWRPALSSTGTPPAGCPEGFQAPPGIQCLHLQTAR